MTTYAKLAGELRRLLLKLPADAYNRLTGAELRMLADIEGGELVCVPAEPTEAMLDAAVADMNEPDTFGWHEARCTYRAMLKAAGESP